MSSVTTWRSSWPPADGNVNEQLLPDSRGGVASLPTPLQLSRPASDTSTPCELSLQWTSQPLRCLQLQLEIQCSARHVELHAVGTKRNLLGEEEQGQVYLGTFRGAKQSDPLLFTMSPAFKQSDRNCDVLKSLQTFKIKFVSLTGDKSELKLQTFRCIFVPMESVANKTSGLADKMAGIALTGEVPDVQKLLTGFQQTLEREMETKIAKVVDAKLSTLSQRLAFSEQALFQLHKKMDAKDANVQKKLEQIQQQFVQLEDQVNQFGATKEKAKSADSEEADELVKKAVVSTEGE